MADRLSIALVTADQRRHAWFAAELARDPRLLLAGVVREAKRPRPRGETEDQDRLIVEHLAARDEAERRYFGEAPDVAELGVPVLDVPWGGSNDESTAAWPPAHRLVVRWGASAGVSSPATADAARAAPSALFRSTVNRRTL